jgi:hypothetical protein
LFEHPVAAAAAMLKTLVGVRPFVVSAMAVMGAVAFVMVVHDLSFSEAAEWPR